MAYPSSYGSRVTYQSKIDGILESLAKYFKLPRKTPLSSHIWLDAALSRDYSAMRLLEKHCQRDVQILMGLAPIFRQLWRHLGSTGSFY